MFSYSYNKSIFLSFIFQGGGLARIVGTMTEHQSVSFSPPGLGLSYRKYSYNDADAGISLRIPSSASLHHNSIAVLTENDWYA